MLSGKVEMRGWALEEHQNLMKEWNEPCFRGSQIFQWIQKQCCDSFGAMTNLPFPLRRRLQLFGEISLPPVLQHQISPEDETEKYLLKLKDGETLEMVLMSYSKDPERMRNTVCVSSQVGCAIGCKFCASTLNGWKRNLSQAEILAQVAVAERRLKSKSSKAGVTNVVFMGMGEPLLNYEAVLKAINILNHRCGLNIGARHITLSTCGLVPQIRRLAGEGLQLVLAVSLHAPENFLRNELVPINKRYPLNDLMEACRYYIKRTGRRVTFEYILIGGVNDSPMQAEKLGTLLRGMLVHVNLIAFNAVEGKEYSRPKEERVVAFKRKLMEMGIETSVREAKGTGIDAACGQLRLRAR